MVQGISYVAGERNNCRRKHQLHTVERQARKRGKHDVDVLCAAGLLGWLTSGVLDGIPTTLAEPFPCVTKLLSAGMLMQKQLLKRACLASRTADSWAVS